MRLMLRGALVLLASTIGCRARQAPSPSACLVANTATAGGKAIEPRWLRLTGLRVTSDTTGVAEVGAYGAATMDGHWWRFGGDSLRVDAADVFNGVWLRLRLQNDGVVGRATIQTDAGSGSTTPWRAKWAACPGSASRPAT